jgi:DNA-binding NtrC family response regulator
MNPHVRVLISSGYAGDSRLIDMLKEGSTGFIKKPFEIGQLSRKIREILNKD